MNQPKAAVIPEMEDFSEQVGEFIQYWGFKNIHGKIWAHLFLSEVPLDSAELIARLGVSKALISISIKELLKYNVIVKAGRSPTKTQLYRGNPEPISVILGVLRQRERSMISRIAAAHGRLSQLSATERRAQGIPERGLIKVGQLIAIAEQGLDALLALQEADTAIWKRAGKWLPAIKASAAQVNRKFAAVESTLALLRRDRTS